MSTQQQQPEKKKRVSKKASETDAEMKIEATEPKKRSSKKKVVPENDTTIQLQQLINEEKQQISEIEKYVEESMTNPSRDVIGHLGEYIEEPYTIISSISRCQKQFGCSTILKFVQSRTTIPRKTSMVLKLKSTSRISRFTHHKSTRTTAQQR